ncbi:MAG: hypothetical protein JWO38_7797 [Gemmataceae bacterium]|nr:hypothetical protein [Gemmataceae bacterium]
MNTSTLKILVPVGLLVVVVFAVTFFSQYTPTGREETKGAQKAEGEKPLLFSAANSVRRWDPFSSNLPDHAFTGFYETGETQHAATFWFENANRKPVSMRLQSVSCSACSGGRLAPIPPETTKLVLQMAAVSALPQGLVAGFPLGMAGPAANLLDTERKTLVWQSHRFDQDPASVVFNVPAAADTDGWSPQWGILELNFKVRPSPKIPLRAAFITQIQDTELVETERFEIWYEPAGAFEVDRPAIDAGDLTDATTAQTHEVIIYSCTRTPDQMPNLTVQVMMPTGAGGEPGGFVSTGNLVPIVGPDLGRFTVDLSNKLGRPTRVRSAFRLPVTIKGRDGDARLDIGDMVRMIWVAQGGEQKSVTVKGVVRGPVHLSEGKEINLGSFKTADGTNEKVFITTEQTGIDLEVVRDQTRPEGLEVSLEKRPDQGDRGYYQLRVTVPPGKQEGAIRDGVVVLAVKGPTPQRFRIPVRGQGTR